MDDEAYLHEFLDRITDDERATLKYNIDRGVGFANPENAMPGGEYG